MELKNYKRHIEGLAKMNNPPVSQCIALLRQLYSKLEDLDIRLSAYEQDSAALLEKQGIDPDDKVDREDLKRMLNCLLGKNKRLINLLAETREVCNCLFNGLDESWLTLDIGKKMMKKADEAMKKMEEVLDEG